jgi:hypothetical protein
MGFMGDRASVNGELQSECLKRKTAPFPLNAVSHFLTSPISGAHNKIANLENDLDMASRRNQDLLDQQREREREYTKLKANYDKVRVLGLAF